MTAAAYATALHRSRVAELKAAPRLCWWCRESPATVVDHVTHFVDGGRPDGPWVGACVPCNSRRAQAAGVRARARARGYVSPRFDRRNRISTRTNPIARPSRVWRPSTGAGDARAR